MTEEQANDLKSSLYDLMQNIESKEPRERLHELVLLPTALCGELAQGPGRRSGIELIF